MKIKYKLLASSIFLSSFGFGQTFKMMLKITNNETEHFNNLKYNIKVYDCTKDSSYDYITPSNFVLLFNYDSFYKITISSKETNSHEYFLSNYGPHKNFLMNLIVPLKDDSVKSVKKLIYYSKSTDRYYVDKL